MSDIRTEMRQKAMLEMLLSVSLLESTFKCENRNANDYNLPLHLSFFGMSDETPYPVCSRNTCRFVRTAVFRKWSLRAVCLVILAPRDAQLHS